MLHPADPLIAVGLLTRLPVRVHAGRAQARGARASWAYPLPGLLVGTLGAGAQAGALWLGLGPGLAAGLALVVLIMVTGALHEDGLADCADGFWGGWTREKRLQIMHDSRIGTYGVLALGLALLLRWQSMVELSASWTALPVAAVLSRAAMTAVWAALPPARADGLAQGLGRPSAAPALIASGIAIGLAAILAGPGAACAATLAAGLGATAVGLVARARIGGQSGDVMGAAQQVSEIFCLLSLTLWA
ncbi:MAG: adenosylcobinamide-GDP ribazoletransferase [Rhodobacteraceae bacterium]|nr:adenosylcobinamide-GDP ribazoletransferase [Paracoccaceae bacterium]